VVDATKSLLERNRAKSGEFVADVHVKAHGYPEGELRVLPNLPEELAQGLFGHEAIYRTVVRFSNSAPHAQADALPDGRGMAVKVFAVTGEMVTTDGPGEATQDFLMINHPVFFARNVKDFLRMEEAIVVADHSPLAAAQKALTGGDWNPLHWHWRETITAARTAVHFPANPASNIYYSASPIRYGKYVAKFRMKATGHRLDNNIDMIKRLGTEKDAMRLALEETLHTQEVLFEFQVQLRNSEQTMPIEDPSVEWPESESPYRTVAHLLLPRQEIDALRTQAAYQNLAFNPWHSLAAHRPLGGINRARRVVYPVSSDWRRQQPGV
jgi:catalase